MLADYVNTMHARISNTRQLDELKKNVCLESTLATVQRLHTTETQLTLQNRNAVRDMETQIDSFTRAVSLGIGPHPRNSIFSKMQKIVRVRSNYHHQTPLPKNTTHGVITAVAGNAELADMHESRLRMRAVRVDENR